MALFDAIYEFSDAQSIVINSGSSSVSTDVVDLGSDMKDAFRSAVTTQKLAGYGGPPLTVVITINTTMVGGKITAALKSKASSASISSGATSHGTVVLTASSTAGTKFTIPVPTEDFARYVGLLYTAASGNVTAGAVDAYLAMGDQIID